MRSRPPTGTESAALEPRSYPDGWSALWRGSGGRAEEVNLKKKRKGRKEKRRGDSITMALARIQRGGIEER